MISNRLQHTTKFLIRSYSTSTLVQPGKFKISNDTISTRLEQAAVKYEHLDALSTPDNKNFTLTFSNIYDNVVGLASGFVEGNLKDQELILSNVPQGTEHMFTQMAAAKIGARYLSVPPSSSFQEIGELIKSSNAKVLVIGDSSNRTMIEEARDFFPNLLTIGYHEYHRDTRFPSLKFIYSIQNRQEPGIDLLSDIVLDVDLCKYRKASPSSISTVTPVNGKLIGFSHNSLLNTGDALVELLGLKNGDRVLLGTPLHLGSSYSLYLGCLTNGVFVAVTESEDIGELLTCIPRDQCSTFYATGKLLEDLIKTEQFAKEDLSSLKRLIISGDVDPQVLKAFEQKANFNTIILSNVENLPCQLTGVAFNSQGVGRLLPNIEAKVVDQKGNTVPRGQHGKLLTKGFHVNSNNTSEWLDTGLNIKMNSDGSFSK